MPRSLTPWVGPILTNPDPGLLPSDDPYRIGNPENNISTLYRLACTYPCQRFAAVLADDCA
jgi:hypothetical protein